MAEQIQIGAYVEEDHIVVRVGPYGAAMTVANAIKMRDSIQRAILDLTSKTPVKLEEPSDE